MYVVVRQYAGAGELADVLAERSDDVTKVISSVPGFVAYHGARDGDHFMSITVCNDRAGAEESSRRAAAWVKENLSGRSIGAPDISQGEVFINF